MPHRIRRGLLRINLDTRKVTRDVIPEECVELLLGGRALGDDFLYHEIPAGIEPLSPDNKLFFSAGPLTGTSAPATSRYVIHTKSPQTGLYLCTLSGGYFGPELRRTGHDMLIIEGASDQPIYLAIWDEKVEIRDATHLWGMPTDTTQEFIKEELGDSKARIACIGPAGERLVPYAGIINERRAAGRGGAGAVMGSKKLKAVVVRGSRQVEVANSEVFRIAVRHALSDIDRNPLVSKEFTLYGSHHGTSALSAGGIVPWRNWQNGSSPKAKELFPETWREKFVVQDVRCAPPCSVKCSKITLVREGSSAGAISEGPDYEAVYSFGSCCDISDFAAIIEADALCDKYGLDAVSMGVSIAFAMECYERGIINNSDTGGLELKFGQGHLLSRLVHDTAYRQCFGEVLSLGTKKMSEMFGKGSDAFAMHAKGLEIGGYDPRGAKSVALIYACGPRGGCHKAGGPSNFLSMMELQRKGSPLSTRERAAVVKSKGDKRVLSDSIIFCIFQHMGISDEVTVELLNAAAGFNWSIEELYAIGERGSNLERMFNVREGLRRSWDTLPPRLLNESPVTGPNQGQVVKLDELVTEFYRIRGWDIETGIPTAEKLNELGLGKILSELNSSLKAAADKRSHD